jgi:replicative DNA helicase
MDMNLDPNEIAMRPPQSEQLRIPPHSIPAESSVLGALLLDNSTIDLVADLLSANDFYLHSHKLTYQAILDLANRYEPADVVSVFERLKANGHDDDVGLSYLNELAQYVPNTSNITNYANTIREQSILRGIIGASEESIRQAFARAGEGAQKVLEDAEKRVLAIAETANKKFDTKSIDEVLATVLDRLQDRADNPGLITGVQTGFTHLDKITSGLQAGELIVIAGRPSMGKTALAMNIVEHAAINHDVPTLVVSLEMKSELLGRRLLGSVGRVDQQRLMRGELSDSDWTRVSEASAKLHGKTIDILDDASQSLAGIRAIARRVARKHKKLGLIVIDYLQLIDSNGGSFETRNTEISAYSRGLKLLANELECPVIVLSQLNRAVESRNDKRPLMSDLRDSGAVEQDADAIYFIYRDEYYTKDACKEPGVVEIIVAKQRNGPTGTVRLAWQGNYVRFDNL